MIKALVKNCIRRVPSNRWNKEAWEKYQSILSDLDELESDLKLK